MEPRPCEHSPGLLFDFAAPKASKFNDIMIHPKSQAKMMMINPRWCIFNHSIRDLDISPLKVTFPTFERGHENSPSHRITRSWLLHHGIPLESRLRFRLLFLHFAAWEAWIWRKKKHVTKRLNGFNYSLFIQEKISLSLSIVITYWS